MAARYYTTVVMALTLNTTTQYIMPQVRSGTHTWQIRETGYCKNEVPFVSCHKDLEVFHIPCTFRPSNRQHGTLRSKMDKDAKIASSRNFNEG